MATVNKALLSKIGADLDVALAEIAKKHGLTSLKIGNGTYNTDNFTFKIEGLISGGKTKEALRYESYRTFNSHLPELDTVVRDVVANKSFKITGINTTGTKIFATCVEDNKGYQIPVSYIERIIATAIPSGGATPV